MALKDDIDRLLDVSYLEELGVCGDDRLRAMRTECQEVEAKLSYLRRMVQGRLDIVNAERERRASGSASSDLSDLVARLPEILADRGRTPGPGRMPTNLVPPDDEDLTRELDDVSGPAALGSLPDLSDEDLQAVAGRLEQLERTVSAQRRAIFGVIDAVQGELAGRYEQQGDVKA